MVHVILMTQDSLQLQKTVLVVGSDLPVTSAVSTLLSSWKLECARDNEEALALVKKSAFDLVITDQGSSGREDAELLREIRLVRPHTRLIIVTDRNRPADVIAAIRARAFSYFTKPLSTQALEEMLQLAMESPAWEEGIEMLSGRMRGYVFRCAVMLFRPIGCISSFASFWICPKLIWIRWRQRAGKCY